MELAGKVVIVTGAGSGIGRALAERFAGEDARTVVVADLHGDAAAAVAGGLGDVGVAMEVDVADEQAVARMVHETEDRFGPIDLLVSNAGIFRFGDPSTPDGDWNLMWQVHVMAHVYAARYALPSMLARGEGYFLNTASAAGLLTQIGSAPYSVTKHGAVGFAEWLSITYGDRGIKVSVLCPQAVHTAMTDALGGGGVAAVDGMIEPEDVAAAAIEGLHDERFLILPHTEVREYMHRKVSDYDRWLAGMRRLQSRFGRTPE
jgi:NAD(P)-dependent dehydrogenase (short-subunit alcohol dehydrogenase family)